MPKIIFQIGNDTSDAKEVELVPDQTLLEAADQSGVEIPAACGGQGVCGQCKVQIMTGSEKLNQPTESERGHLGSANFAVGERLACQTKLQGE